MTTKTACRRISAGLLAVAATVAAGAFAAGALATGSSGARHPGTIAGHVYGAGGPHTISTRGPRPVAGVTVVAATAGGERVAHTVSRAGGSFRLRLAPGRYRLSARVGGRLCGSVRRLFTVRAGQITRASLGCSLR